MSVAVVARLGAGRVLGGAKLAKAGLPTGAVNESTIIDPDFGLVRGSGSGHCSKQA